MVRNGGNHLRSPLIGLSFVARQSSSTLTAAGQYIGSGMALLPVLVYAANGIGIHALYPYAGMRNASIRLALGACIVLNRHCRVFNPVVLFALNTGFPAQNLAHK